MIEQGISENKLIRTILRIAIIGVQLGICCFLAIILATKYRDLTERGWKITQYEDASGKQGMFYSICNKQTGGVILIDSGNPQNAEQVRSVVQKLGEHVDAWFLTHYHPDHIGAFNEIWNEMKDKVDQIFITPIDYETYASRAHEWDDPATFRTFLEATKDCDKITVLHRGEVFEIDGLKIQIFNAFDEHVKDLSNDWCNDCSLVIKVSGERESMLFLGDLSRDGVALGEYILDTFGVKEVSADFVQGGHHGNWGLPIGFYEKIEPKVFFFNAPGWLMTGEEYDAKDMEAWCKKQGIITHDYREGNVSFVLH